MQIYNGMECNTIHVKMLFKGLCLSVLFLIVSSEVCDETVQNLVTEINTFINSTETYTIHSDVVQADGNEVDVGGSYDFIIVGGGTAGSVLANRLTQSGKWTVLVLEAGGVETNLNKIPAMSEYLKISDNSWGCYSDRQDRTLMGFNNKSQRIIQGIMLGGSSTLGDMLYTRGSPQDFDDLDALGNTGWSYKNLLPLFKKIENASFPYQNVQYHGHSGEVPLDYENNLSPLMCAFVHAHMELGGIRLDYNGPSQMGASQAQVMSKCGQRISAAEAFLKPVIDRDNLKISTNSIVRQIVIDDGTATGVLYIKDNKMYKATCKKEVILSAGAIASPHILMVSGIGPSEMLKANKITVKSNLPVGNNLWDHVYFDMIPVLVNLDIPQEKLEDEVREYLEGNGPLTVSGQNQAIRFINTYGSKDVPNVAQIFSAGRNYNKSYNYYKKTLNINQNIYNYRIKPMEGKVTWQTKSMLLKPKSKGRVTLRSEQIYGCPHVDTLYFTDSKNEDIKVLLAAVRDMERIAQTRSMQNYNSMVQKVQIPGCKPYKIGTDEHVECLLRHLSISSYQFGGTCRMGPDKDKQAVVDPRLRVRGVKKLRVVDSSIIPEPITGHTLAMTLVIGEKGSDMIKEDYNHK